MTEGERMNAEKEIYAAAVRQLVVFGGFPVGPLTGSEILVVDYFPRTCSHNGVEWICNYGDRSDPVDRFSKDMKSEISTAIKRSRTIVQVHRQPGTVRTR